MIDLFDNKGCTSFIWAANNPDLMDFIKYQSSSCWKAVQLGDDSFEVCEFDYPPFFGKSHSKNTKTQRIVAMRRPADDGKLHHATNDLAISPPMPSGRTTSASS